MLDLTGHMIIWGGLFAHGDGISRTMMEWLTLKWSATLLWLKPPLCMPTACHLSGRWTIRTWRQVHWSDESRFLLRPTGGRARAWRQRNTSFQDQLWTFYGSSRSHSLMVITVRVLMWPPNANILGTTAFGGGGVTVWGCFSFDCMLDLYVIDGNLTGQKYHDNVLAPRVVPHFDNHAPLL
jgi:hypothetical protein